MPSKPNDSLTHWLVKNPKNNKSKAFLKEVTASKKAILHYKTIKQLENHVLLEIKLETGRHHQIRSQLSAIGCPIRGDLKYGFNRSNSNSGIHLHARFLEITHPVTKELMCFEAPVPKDNLWQSCI